MRKKTDFAPFNVGVVHAASLPKFESVKISYPSRLNAMAIDPSMIARDGSMQYAPGEIIFKVGIYKQISIKLSKTSGEIIIDRGSKREPLIMHAALIMKRALNFNVGLEINVENSLELRHVGLGSSSGLIASVAVCINELFGKPLSDDVLLRYLAQNHGEEIDNNFHNLMPVQCIGGSAAAGLYGGAMIIIAGHNRVISSLELDQKYKAVIGIPEDFQEMDSKTLLEKEIKSFPKFMRCGKKYGPIIAYNILHKVLPAITEGKLGPAGELIYQYRFRMGSINNCSYHYKKLPFIAKRIEYLKTNNVADVLSLSSVGPAFFAITTKASECRSAFKKAGLNTLVVSLTNDKYKIISKK